MVPPHMDEAIVCKRMDFLRKIPPFASLREEDLRVLAGHFRARPYGKKEIIFHQGDTSHDLYVVMSGRARIFCVSPSGNETSFRVFSASEMIGEFATTPKSAKR